MLRWFTFLSVCTVYSCFAAQWFGGGWGGVCEDGVIRDIYHCAAAAAGTLAVTLPPTAAAARGGDPRIQRSEEVVPIVSTGSGAD